MYKIVHVISGLNIGGAETMLYRLLSNMDETKFSLEVISLTDIGPVGKKIQKLGIPVRSLGMESGVPNLFASFRLIRWLRASSPDLVQTWMYHADFMVGLVVKLAGMSMPVIWGIRQTELKWKSMKKTTVFIAKINAWLSHWIPEKIICCAEAAKRAHALLGYDREKMVVIPNGFDLQNFHPDDAARRSVRSELGLSDDTMLIGLIARFEPMKDHRIFVRAAGLLIEFPELHFLLSGRDINWENKELVEWIMEAGIEKRIHLLGNRDDIAQITSALDIATLSSLQEGFPNVVAEAMASGVPCVVTNVGDAARIVGDTGIVVPPRNTRALAKGWRELLHMSNTERRSLGAQARQRVQDNYSIESTVQKYQDFYIKVLSQKNR
ncbi:MAG: glycosyltransferase [Patescibacteria group bacterium]|nr:glycosyltransferase [Patescibacteria group bacterium]